MRVDAFDFVLPPERIALAPASPRDSARMLVVGADGGLTDSWVLDLPSFLRRGDALVVNDTRVIAARLEGVRIRGDAIASIEATLTERVDDCRWRALARPAKKLKVGERIRFGDTRESMACLLAALDAEVEGKGEAGEVLLRFHFAGAALDEAIERLGAPPLPPYIASRRRVSPSDSADYQTMFAAKPGAVAAPTAGLHFTPALVARLAEHARCAPSRDPACRRRDFRARQGRGYARPQDAFRVGLDRGCDRRCSQRRAGGRRPGRLRRHDLRAHRRERRRREWAASTVCGPNGYFHRPRIPVSLRRRADDQLSFAAVDAVHACLGVQWA
jgi:hypothetical protein